MTEPAIPPPPRRPISTPAAHLVRLLAVTVELFADFEPIENEPVLEGAVQSAVQALSGLVAPTVPGMTEESLSALAATVAELPGP